MKKILIYLGKGTATAALLGVAVALGIAACIFPVVLMCELKSSNYLWFYLIHTLSFLIFFGKKVYEET